MGRRQARNSFKRRAMNGGQEREERLGCIVDRAMQVFSCKHEVDKAKCPLPRNNQPRSNKATRQRCAHSPVPRPMLWKTETAAKQDIR